VIVPVGVEAPANVAVSVMVPPATTAGDATVEIVGAAWPTVTDSLGSLHVPATAVLLASPL